MKRLIFLLFLIPFTCTGQEYLDFLTDPGTRTITVFDDVAGWWRADNFSGTAGSYVLIDKSAHNNSMGQQAGTLTAGTGVNSQARFTGNASAWWSSNLLIKSWPVTIITVAVRTNNATCGFFGHTGASGFNTLWFGYEASNENRIYNTNSSANTTAEAGSIACYVARIGFGSRVTMINGLIQSTMSLASITQSASLNSTIGTQYRGANMDWYETLVWDRTLSLTELDEVSAYLNTRYAMSLPLWSSYTEANMLGYGGQSNSDGRGDRGASDTNIPVAYRSSLSNVFVWDGSAYPNMDLSTNTVFNPLYIGQELTSAKDYADDIGENVYVQKFALGSTSMSYTASGNNGYWTHVHSTAMSDVRAQYGGTLSEFWQAMRVHQLATRRPNMIGYTFYQGEDDATDNTFANNWSSLAEPMFTAMRDEMGLGDFKIFLVRIHTGIDGTQHPFKATVRTQQDNTAASFPNTQLVSVDTYGLRDAAHIDVNGQLDLGYFLATQF